MNWLKAKYKEKEQFYKILAIAIGVNLALIIIFMAISVSVKDITITVNGKSIQHKTIRNSVSDMLRGWDVTLDEKDVVTPGEDAVLKDGTDVDIRLFEVTKETVKEETDFKTKKEYTSDLFEGKSKVVQEGVKGEDKVTYKITSLGGEIQTREELKRETVKKPVTEIVAEGTAIAYNGEKYSRKITVSSTAYCLRGRTATGTSVHYGTIAVDPRVIPLGSYGYVPGYGEVHAEDTGGAIKGKIIDLWFPSNGQCRSWGRRTVDIYIK